MTVSTIVPVNNHKGNASNKTFDFDFLIEDESELVVTHISKDGIIRTLNAGIDYSINEIGNPSGSFITFPLEGSNYDILNFEETISLSLNLKVQQQSEFKNSSHLNLSVLEWTFDYIIRILQIFDRKISRSIKIQEGTDGSPDDLLDNINDSAYYAQECANEAQLSSQKAKESLNSTLAKEQTFENLLVQVNNKVNDFEENYTECMQNLLQDFQTRLSNLKSTYEECIGNIYATGIDKKVNLDLDNLSEKGQQIIDFKTDKNLSNITNDGIYQVTKWIMPSYQFTSLAWNTSHIYNVNGWMRCGGTSTNVLFQPVVSFDNSTWIPACTVSNAYVSWMVFVPANMYFKGKGGNSSQGLDWCPVVGGI